MIKVVKSWIRKGTLAIANNRCTEVGTWILQEADRETPKLIKKSDTGT